jgi:chemotaxis-related protein WspD
MMSDTAATAGERCWIATGVWGNGTCGELPRVWHCRNCEVYTAHGRQLLDRPAPDDYIESWTALLAQDRPAADATLVPHLVFRIGETWLAFRATTLREITTPSVIRSVPHRPREVLLGLVNVRGELHPCVSLHSLFGEETAGLQRRTARFLVARQGHLDWVFPVDQVDGMHEVAADTIEGLPATLERIEVAYTRGLFRSGDKTVAVIDEDLLFGVLARRIA